MNIFLKCGPAVFLLRDFCNESPFVTWQWKLDPFRTDSASEDVTEINFNKTAVDIANISTVSREKDGFYSREVLKTENGTVWKLIRNNNSEVVLSFAVDDSERKIQLIEDNTETSGQAAFEFLSRIAVYSMIDSSVLTFHGVLMEINGKGVIISAPSETGKTTHARLWRDEKNALIINGDNACCYKENGVWKGFGIPWSGTSGENLNRNVEIAALAILERAEENNVRRIDEYYAFRKLYSLIHYPSWDIRKTDAAFDLCNDFLHDVPVFELECLPDIDAVETLHRALEELI